MRLLENKSPPEKEITFINQVAFCRTTIDSDLGELNRGISFITANYEQKLCIDIY